MTGCPSPQALSVQVLLALSRTGADLPGQAREERSEM